MAGPGAELRFAALSVLGLMAARILTDSRPASVLTALAALALSVAMASRMSDTSVGLSPFIAAAVIAIGVSVLHIPEPDGT
jgi:hypothetical protein